MMLDRIKMEDLLKQTLNLKEKANNYCEEVAKVIGIQPHEMPAGVFGMIFNKLTLWLELIDYYYKVWGKTIHTNCSSIEEAKQENAQRIIMMQRMIFIEIMSSIEFCSKKYVEQHPRKIGRFTGKVYLWNIMEKSKSKKYNVISDSEFTLWKGVIIMRNSFAHNNGISEENAECNYPNYKLTLHKDKEIHGNLTLFLWLIDWLLDSFRSWILQMDMK